MNQGIIYTGNGWRPFVDYQYNDKGDLVFDLGKGRTLKLPEDVSIRYIEIKEKEDDK